MTETPALQGSLDVLESLVNGTQQRRGVLDEEMRRAEGAQSAYKGLVKFLQAQLALAKDVGESGVETLNRVLSHAEGADAQLRRHYDSMVGRLEECKWREESLKEMAQDVRQRLSSDGESPTIGAPPSAQAVLATVRKRKGARHDDLPAKG